MHLSFIACDAVMHTSASLTINENASSDVPLDLNVSCVVIMLLGVWWAVEPFALVFTYVRL